jgi:hypothetical protein
MWIANSDKKRFLDLISSRDPIKTLNVKSSNTIEPVLGNDQILLAWRNKPSHLDFPLPEVICVYEGKIREFLAWASTYIPNFQPFTAYCRVIEQSNFSKAKDRTQTLLKSQSKAMMLGAIIGEAITHCLNKNIKQLTPTSIMSTVSFAIVRGLSVGYGFEDSDNIINKWDEARHISNQQRRKLDCKDIKQFWNVVISLDRKTVGLKNNNLIGKDSDHMIDACLEMQSNGFIGKDVWKKFTDNFMIKNIVEEDFKGPREERVKLFEKYTSSILSNSHVPKPLSSFLLAYLAYRVAPGQFDYTHLLSPLLIKYPDTIMWYGFFTGLSKKTDIYNYNYGMGWRILYDLMAAGNIFDRSASDISIDELDVILNVDKPNTNIRASNPNHLIVEIAPMIYTSIHWPHPQSSGQLELFDRDPHDEKLQYTLRKLGQTINTARFLFDDYTKLSGGIKEKVPNRYDKTKY